MLWAKRRDALWHSLVGHSIDVAAAFAALVAQPTIATRLAQAARSPALSDLTRLRLAALSFLHDIGKTNRGFQARSDPTAPLVGHIDELSWLFSLDPAARPLCDRLIDRLGLERIFPWFANEADGEAFITAIFAHHGRPWRSERRGEPPPSSKQHWQPGPDGDPIAALAPMREHLDRLFAAAFAEGPPLPSHPNCHHAFAGLLMLADWLGSDERFFALGNGEDEGRYELAAKSAPEALKKIGLAVETRRAVLRDHAVPFECAFPFPPKPLQRAAADVAAPLLVIEAQTGSGKTEAALWRFKTLFERGEVDGLYFALPTRVAATQMFGRVKRFRDGLFPADDRPGVVLAVPGQARFDAAEAQPLPDFGVQWSDGGGDDDARWAAERPKRFLAATIAVGTVDQALLAAVRVKHAHMRAALLMRQLLVVDEVHASSVYSGEILRQLLRNHLTLGGHALLLSATLGGAMRARLIGTPEPDADAAAQVAYPALSWNEGGREQRLAFLPDGEDKAVSIAVMPALTEPEAIAARALAAARDGAAVLVIRNTVGAAVEVARALEERAGPDSPLLFRANGVATLHHSRFAPGDRRLLDQAAEEVMGKQRPSGRGIVVVGTQTLEISLDIDADLLISDLCPVDVLLQRIGRLHRHLRARPAGYGEPRLVLIVPPERDLLAAHWARYGLGPTARGGVYADLRSIEATWRLAEREPLWRIPAMNRRLVEAATHPDRLAAIEAEDARWRQLADVQVGRTAAERQAALMAVLDISKPFTECEIPRDRKLATRLGGEDRAVDFDPPLTGPFGEPVSELSVPEHLMSGVAREAVPAKVVDNGDGFAFALGEIRFSYGRFGLLKEES